MDKTESGPRPVPDLAREARALIEARGFGVLATISKRNPGYPFASIVNFALDSEGRPVFVMSGLAVHTKNLLEEPKASLCVYSADAEADVLSAARMNITGEVRGVPEADLEAARSAFFKRHPEAEPYMEFVDFAAYRMSIVDIYYVGGFGNMGFIATQDFRSASL
jgi:putative heme iron utilization protein